jgi:hypothetical protein
MLKSSKQNYYLISQELFYVLSAAMGIFILLELAWPGVVRAYINISFVLLIWLVNAILMLMLDDKGN